MQSFVTKFTEKIKNHYEEKICFKNRNRDIISG